MLQGRNSYPGGNLCSPALPYTTPETQLGCTRVDIAHVHSVPSDFSLGHGVRGARATWTIRQLDSGGWQNDGFTQQGLWLGIDHQPASGSATAAWLEVGVTRGFAGANYFGYFWGHGDLRTEPDTFEDFQLSGTPVPGQEGNFTLANCGISHSGWQACLPWNASLSPRQWRVCAGSDSNCTLFTGPPGIDPRTKEYHDGSESTCLEGARIDKTFVHDIQYLNQGSNWAFTNNLGVGSSFIGTFPPPASTHDIDCCGGQPYVDPTDGKTKCPNPNQTRYWINSQTPTNTCAP